MKRFYWGLLKYLTPSTLVMSSAEIFYRSEGDPVVTFNLAFRSSKKKTSWIKVTCFGRLAEVASRCLHKGARIAIVGTLDQQHWQTDKGDQRSRFQLIANTLEFINAVIQKAPVRRILRSDRDPT